MNDTDVTIDETIAGGAAKTENKGTDKSNPINDTAVLLSQLENAYNAGKYVLHVICTRSSDFAFGMGHCVGTRLGRRPPERFSHNG